MSSKAILRDGFFTLKNKISIHKSGVSKEETHHNI
jgi:hypothetical protein